ncbi:Aste57867_12673 [Aphanomyces stellatus]|uniref:Aste57867_12673 protein n=1 Tax=Aphanomyces stellatus TaxID=120398 RepID=A0A485KWM0_9STRA|nr:hypothetical protein As57867_012626 [Aphanomyces stellatus]VFT89523.1 Aste57867_12673 [Aphanomyces stellatus]
MSTPDEADQAYADLHDRFVYLQQQTQRLGAAYTLATQELESLHEDNTILKDKLLQIRVRRRNLAAQAEASMSSNMTAKALFCRRNRRVLRKQFPLVSREQLSSFVEDEWESLSRDSLEKWQRDFKSYIPKPVGPVVPLFKWTDMIALVSQKPVKAPKEERPPPPPPSTEITPVKKAAPKSRKKPAASATPTDDAKPKPKRATPKKKAATTEAAAPTEKKTPKKSPAKKKGAAAATAAAAAAAAKNAKATKRSARAAATAAWPQATKTTATTT